MSPNDVAGMISARIMESMKFADEAYVNKSVNAPVVFTAEEANSILVAMAELSDSSLGGAFSESHASP